MKPSYEELQKQIQVLQQDLAFARDDASQWKMKAEDAQETLRDRFAMAYISSASHSVPANAYRMADDALKARVRKAQ